MHCVHLHPVDHAIKFHGAKRDGEGEFDCGLAVEDGEGFGGVAFDVALDGVAGSVGGSPFVDGEGPTFEGNEGVDEGELETVVVGEARVFVVGFEPFVNGRAEGESCILVGRSSGYEEVLGCTWAGCEGFERGVVYLEDEMVWDRSMWCE